MKPILLAFVAWAGAAAAFAQSFTTTLVAPTISGTAGSEVVVDLVVLNSAAAAQDVTLPQTIPARVVVDGQAHPVSLTAQDESLRGSVPSGGFVRVSYQLRLPVGVPSRAVLELDQPGRLRAVLDVAAPASVATRSVAQVPVPAAEEKKSEPDNRGRSGLVPRPAASRIERTFREHFGTHEPVYFIYGDEVPSGKFQLSFKYRLFGDAGDRPESTRNSLQFGYTQRSLWDLEAASSPFLDTSYMPEVFYEHFTPDNPDGLRWLTWLGLQSGYKHESNGRDGEYSRSMNTVYLRTALAVGDLEGWRLILEPRVFTYVSDMSDNRDMKHYRGYGELRAIIGKNDDFELLLTGRLGSDWHRPTIQADLTLPLRLRFGDFASYLLIQYFHGYGESILYYRQETESLRAGFSFVR